MSIDRIGLVMPVAEKQLYAELCLQFHSMKGEPGYKVWKTKYQTNAVMPLSGYESLRLQAGVSHHQKYLRVDFNPASLTPDDWAMLHVHLDLLLEFGYSGLVSVSEVSYLEIAVDVPGVAWKGLLHFDSQLRNSFWYPDFYHPTPTGYLGRRGSNRVVRGYDRVARLQATGKPAPNYAVTRIEAVLRKLGCNVGGLAGVDNPFMTVGVCRFADAEAKSSDKGWKRFLQNCRYVGACEAVQLVGTARKKYLTRLSSVACDWWSPMGIWELYPEALKALQG